MKKSACAAGSTALVTTCLLCACGGSAANPDPQPNSPPEYRIGGAVSGLQADADLVLLNGGSDSLAVSANGTFHFPAAVPSGTAYNVTVGTQPSGQTCVVSHPNGTVGSLDITNILVLCPYVSSIWDFPIDADGLRSGTTSGVILGGDGNFHGVTASGGANNEGAVYRISPSGSADLRWSFGAGTDGWQPHGSLMQASDGNFYGTTFYGGSLDFGAVVKITPVGTESVLWSFGGPGDGNSPTAALVEGSDGNLYGTTAGGGASGKGTVFRLTKAGVETVLWSFGGPPDDGQMPWGGVIQANDGNFYGTTTEGGSSNNGTVFRVSPTGSEEVIWNFGSGTDGRRPFGPLLQASDGQLYGTTQIGGRTQAGGLSSSGTIFRVTLAGVESVLHTFDSATGSAPEGGLVQGSDGVLYGTTVFGGAGPNTGSGSIYRLDHDGETLVLSRNPYPNTQLSNSVIMDPAGHLYGTTVAFGTTPLPAGKFFMVEF
jgi:uncharacterized repeat protein (TIGR03803 family)